MTPAKFTEASTVQAAIVDRLAKPDLGWKHVRGKDLDRTVDGVLIQRELIDALIRLNPAIAAKPERVEEVLPRIRLAVISAVNDGLVAANERMTTVLRGHDTQKFVGTDTYESIRLIDFEHPENNRYVVSDEVTYGHGPNARRFDVVLWINGIPLVVGEAKSPVDKKVSWFNGAKDVHGTYEVEAAPFFSPNVLSFSTDGREFHYGAVRQPPETWLLWGSTTDRHDLDGPARVLRSVELLLAPGQVLSILRDFTLFDRPVRDGKVTHMKLIPRYPQVEGAEAIHRRVLDPDKRQGLIWHYQGTGKTLLMGFAALSRL